MFTCKIYIITPTLRMRVKIHHRYWIWNLILNWELDPSWAWNIEFQYLVGHEGSFRTCFVQYNRHGLYVSIKLVKSIIFLPKLQKSKRWYQMFLWLQLLLKKFQHPSIVCVLPTSTFLHQKWKKNLPMYNIS